MASFLDDPCTGAPLPDELAERLFRNDANLERPDIRKLGPPTKEVGIGCVEEVGALDELADVEELAFWWGGWDELQHAQVRWRR